MNRIPLAKLTPAGKVLFALRYGPRRFGALKTMTGLSAAWLNKITKALHREGMICYDLQTRSYALKATDVEEQFNSLFPIFLREAAALAAKELGANDGIKAIVLFGSVASGKATSKSDVDLLVILGDPPRVPEKDLMATLSDLGFSLGVSFQPTVLGLKDLAEVLASDVGLVFGIARGYEVLFDGSLGAIVESLEKATTRVLDSYEFIEEGEVWIPKRWITAEA